MAGVRLKRYSSPAYAAACIAYVRELLERGPTPQEVQAAQAVMARPEPQLSFSFDSPRAPSPRGGK